MNHFFDRYYAASTFHELCARYGLAPGDAQLIKEDSNLIYDCGDSILRVSYSAIRTADDVEVELDWLNFLSRKGLPVVRILPTIANTKLAVAGQANDHFTAVLFEKIRGSKISKATWNAAHFQKLGRLTGQLHRVSGDYPKREDLTYHHWDELVECSYADLLPDDERKLQQIHDRLVAEFQGYERTTDNYGFIHNDIHHENYLLTGPGNGIVLFDFEVACQSWYLYEIATALYYACLVNRKRNDEAFERLFLDNFLVGYRQEFDLPPVDFTVVLKFMLYRDLFLFGYMLAVWKHKEQPDSVVGYVGMIEVSIGVRRQRLGW